MQPIETVRDLGFTEYEAKAYLALLAHGQLTGYGVAKESGVPRSKVYEVLETLVGRGDVLVSPGSPAQYAALPASELVARRRARMERELAGAERALAEWQAAGDGRDGVWNLSGREAILSRARACIDEARERVLLEVWAADYAELDASLAGAAARGVEVVAVTYGEVAAAYARIVPHGHDSAIAEEFGGRWLVLSVDDTQVMAGTTSAADDSRAAWSSSPALVMPITEVIVHDLYVHDLLEADRERLEAVFGPELVELRRRYALSPDGLRRYLR